jgi:hypothetical protein
MAVEVMSHRVAADEEAGKMAATAVSMMETGKMIAAVMVRRRSCLDSPLLTCCRGRRLDLSLAVSMAGIIEFITRRLARLVPLRGSVKRCAILTMI